MKKIIAFFIILVMCFAAVNSYAETADEIEEELGKGERLAFFPDDVDHD